MKVNVIEIEPKDMKKYDVTVTGSYRFAHRYHWRVRLGMILLRLAAFVAGFGVKKEVQE